MMSAVSEHYFIGAELKGDQEVVTGMHFPDRRPRRAGRLGSPRATTKLMRSQSGWVRSVRVGQEKSQAFIDPPLLAHLQRFIRAAKYGGVRDLQKQIPRQLLIFRN